MKMRKLNVIPLLFSAALLQAIPAFAGTDVGNGGGAYVCRDAQGQITSAELADLYIGQSRYGLTIPKDETKYADPEAERDAIELAVFGAIRKLREGNRVFANAVRQAYNRSLKHLKLTGPKDRLVQFNDALQPIEKEGCPREQLANYTDVNELWVETKIWNALSITDKAALRVHEAVYKVLRSDPYQAADSRHAVRLVAHAFSTFRFESVVALMPDRPDAVCRADQGWAFSVYRDSEGEPIAQFTEAYGLPAFAKLTARLGSDGTLAMLLQPEGTAGGISSSLQSKYYFEPLDEDGESRTDQSITFKLGLATRRENSPISLSTVDPITGEKFHVPGIRCHSRLPKSARPIPAAKP
jgi:hypothetical protein